MVVIPQNMAMLSQDGYNSSTPKQAVYPVICMMPTTAGSGFSFTCAMQRPSGNSFGPASSPKALSRGFSIKDPKTGQELVFDDLPREVVSNEAYARASDAPLSSHFLGAASAAPFVPPWVSQAGDCLAWSAPTQGGDCLSYATHCTPEGSSLAPQQAGFRAHSKNRQWKRPAKRSSLGPEKVTASGQQAGMLPRVALPTPGPLIDLKKEDQFPLLAAKPVGLSSAADIVAGTAWDKTVLAARGTAQEQKEADKLIRNDATHGVVQKTATAEVAVPKAVDGRKVLTLNSPEERENSKARNSGPSIPPEETTIPEKEFPSLARTSMPCSRLPSSLAPSSAWSTEAAAAREAAREEAKLNMAEKARIEQKRARSVPRGARRTVAEAFPVIALSTQLSSDMLETPPCMSVKCGGVRAWSESAAAAREADKAEAKQKFLEKARAAKLRSQSASRALCRTVVTCSAAEATSEIKVGAMDVQDEEEDSEDEEEEEKEEEQPLAEGWEEAAAAALTEALAADQEEETQGAEFTQDQQGLQAEEMAVRKLEEEAAQKEAVRKAVEEQAARKKAEYVAAREIEAQREAARKNMDEDAETRRRLAQAEAQKKAEEEVRKQKVKEESDRSIADDAASRAAEETRRQAAVERAAQRVASKKAAEEEMASKKVEEESHRNVSTAESMPVSVHKNLSGDGAKTSENARAAVSAMVSEATGLKKTPWRPKRATCPAEIIASTVATKKLEEHPPTRNAVTLEVASIENEHPPTRNAVAPQMASIEKDADVKRKFSTTYQSIFKRGRGNTMSEGLGRTEDLRRSAQCLLNKICPENVKALALKIAELSVGSTEELELVISLIFKKALVEPHYCETYADLVYHLKAEMPAFPSKEGGKPVSFKSTLLNIVQEEFERMPVTLTPNTDEVKEIDAAEMEFRRKQRKGRVLANIKFIGNLFLRQLITAKIIGSVIESLAMCNAKNDALPEEHVVECICELLTAIGLTLESTPLGLASTTQVCGRLLDLKQRKDKKGKQVYSKRLQFGIQDVLEMRAAGWTKTVFKSSAKTKEEIRLEQERDLAAQATGKAVVSGEKVVAGLRPACLDESVSGEQNNDSSGPWQEAKKNKKERC